MSTVRSPVHAMTRTLLLGALLGALPVFAQDYPTRPVRIVTSEAGGGSDLPLRIIVQGLAPGFGQPIVVDNRGGGPITAADAMRAPADGHTLLFYGTSLWILPLMRTSINYDAARDYAPITLAMVTPELLVVHPSLPVRSVKELIVFVKARPGQLNNSSASAGSANNLAAELLKSMAGLDMVRIAYKGATSALLSVVSGETQVHFPVVGAGMEQVKSGKLRALAVTSAEPTTLAPGIPTMTSSGVPGYVAVFQAGLFAPAGTPAPIITRLNRDVVRLLQRPEIRQRYLDIGMEPVGNSPQEFATTIKNEVAVLGKVIKERHIRDE